MTVDARATFDLRGRGIEAIVLDIEGTTTPIAFVTEVLFPYARAGLRAYVDEHLDDAQLAEPIRRLREEWAQDVARGHAPPAWQDDSREPRVASIVAYAEWLMDRDRKSYGLKVLQGHISARGYESGMLRGEVFPDVPPAFARWRAAGLTLAIFSSGSVLAQQQLFRTTAFGDLTRSLDAFFDTTVGPKTSPDSYRRIAEALGRSPGQILFLSDASAEIDAARTAGLIALRCVRPYHLDASGPGLAGAGGLDADGTSGAAADDAPLRDFADLAVESI